MRIDVLTLFPDMVRDPLRHSIVARATSAGIADLHVHDLRDWTFDRRRSADDKPYGGGAGMIMTPRPLITAIREISADGPVPPVRILVCPQGEVLTQRIVSELESAGYLEVIREGRRNSYRVQRNLPMRHPAEAHHRVGELLSVLGHQPRR